ncbi:branched-chain amino acid ABC transporter permease [Verminephrobacter eiseniae]|uniref:branched-chain amino acid ABC transporter permease n=1 Tax=Verminephrobacter eiseniae TaxID=364317 RepID=UPI0010EC0078|nr:branched-chain amino acid ABC transporter permease [Verminephrobacter eiseniae]KAB7585093.1 branched-chain amino acid ABC transporter permease [Verminephrobacter sp. Larva24]MCW5230201.1 branched-chain amino acid ABC transporter permease [Verminephrobacter eiseniae]MCW5291934.1 branched-chain amino acid ABC transporter permease [Verminephrobacter eiseniae]MCW8184913.1 branched-chain amino acid ABC transporter permease [Verminephrobacter eiseniae]MCW8223659.1 branched-chain amino acid ABC tr
MQDFFELLVSAVSTGCIYGLVALAYLLIARPTGIINFAVGEWAALGGFAGYLALSKFELPYAVGMAAVVIFMFCAGWATERTVVRPLIERHAPPLAPVLVLLGMLVIFRESLSLGFGPDPYSVPAGLGFGRFEFGLFAGAYQSLFIIATALTIFAAAWLFFERSLTGKSFAAVAIDRRVAALMGIDLGRVTSMSFAGGAVVAGMAGLLSAPTTSVHYMMGLPLAIQGFTALVIGGANRVAGALFGGLLLALVEQLTIRYLPIAAGLSMGVPLIVLIVFLLVKPEGLLGLRKERA